MTEQAKLIEVGDNYRDRLVEAVDNASERVLLETMALDHIGNMESVLDSCRRARKRGLAVLLIYDRYAYPNLVMERGLGALRSLQDYLKTLESEGVHLQKVGGIEINPFAGRHHAKVVIADDMVYAAGGINLSDEAFSTRDYMFEFQDEELADRLFEQLPIAADERPDQLIIPVDEQSRFILDGGTKGQSEILSTAQDIARRAEKIWYISKLMPDDELQDIMRNKQVEYWFNGISSATGFDKLAIFLDSLRFKLDNNYQSEETLHAKFIVGQMPDGELEAITGSHNFNSRGVRFGTQELALHTRDKAICQQLIDFTKTL